MREASIIFVLVAVVLLAVDVQLNDAIYTSGVIRFLTE
jgi:hypothetical protein